MENNILNHFVALSVNPANGRRVIRGSGLSYGLAGALLMEYQHRGEITISERRITPSFSRNGETLHDYFAEMIESKQKPRKTTYWLERMSGKARFIFRESVNALSAKGILNAEQRYFLNLIPYSRWYFTNPGYRDDIVTGLRNVLLHDREPTGEQRILIGLLKAIKVTDILSLYRQEKKPLVRMAAKISGNNEIAMEIEKLIRDMDDSAAATAVTSSMAASGAD